VLWKEIAAPLLQLPELKNYTWKIYFVRDKVISAHSLPGGIIWLNTGLIENASSAEEVLGVLGHEIGHIMARHSIKEIAEQRFLQQSFNYFSFPEWIIAFHLAYQFYSLKYSRAQEVEADQLSLSYLAKLKVSTAGYYKFFQRFALADKDVPEWLSWLSTHPIDKERLELILSEGKNSEIKELNPLTFKKFKASLIQ